MEEGRFRADLYYRLNIFPIGLPSLRHRRDDIPLLAIHFIHKLSKKIGTTINIVSKYVIEQILSYDWPGNICELEHVIERSILLSDDNILTKIHLPEKKQNGLTRHSENGFIVKTIEENEREKFITSREKTRCPRRWWGALRDPSSVPPASRSVIPAMRSMGICGQPYFFKYYSPGGHVLFSPFLCLTPFISRT